MIESIAIVGATGAVGCLIRQLLEERDFPYKKITFLASKRSAGKTVTFKGKTHEVKFLCPEAFDDIDLAIGSTPDDVAAEFCPWAVERNCVVVDESGYFRMDPKVPLVVPEINPNAALAHQGIISSPNCSTTQMVLAMKPLHDAGKIRRVIVSTYQATSGAGVQGQEDLIAGSRAFLEKQDYEYQAFAHPIAFNLIPQIGSRKEKGYTSEEMKMVYETRKILGDDSMQIAATCVRIPVENCHSETITVETERPVSPDEARKLFASFPGIIVLDDTANGTYPTPAVCSGRDEVFVGRIRRDLSHPNGLNFWCVSDNLRKGAATNAVQIAELISARWSEKLAARST